MTNYAQRIANLSPEQRQLLELKLKRGRANAALMMARHSRENKPVPLSFAQQRLWFVQQLIPDSAAYNVVIALKLAGRLDARLLEASFEEMMRRHEILRTTFISVQGEPVQAISPEVKLDLSKVDCAGQTEEEPEEAAQRLLRHEASTSFDLSRGPLLRVVLAKLAEDKHLMIVTMHHIITDGWSIGVFIQELAATYNGFLNGRSAVLPALEFQYADYAISQREQITDQVLEESIQQWVEKLQGAPGNLHLITDYPATIKANPGKAFAVFEVQPELNEKTKSLGRTLSLTPFMLFLGAFQLLLSKYSGQEDVVVGITVANRPSVELEPLIGLFANTIPVRARCPGDLGLKKYLQQICEVVLDAFQVQHVPFEKIVERLQPERQLGRHPVFQVLFSFLNNPVSPVRLGDLRLEPVSNIHGTARYDLVLEMQEMEGKVRGVIEYNAELFAPETITKMAQRYLLLLEKIHDNRAATLNDISLVTADERKELAQWNSTPLDYPVETCVHELFERQARLTPHACALSAHDGELTYLELENRATQMANLLRRLGAGPEKVVGICMQPSFAMVVAVLGVLKAGAAYLPLDPAHPMGRRAYTVADSGAAIVITDVENAAESWPDQVRIITLDAAMQRLLRQNEHPVCSGASPENAAYLIYTSGSTGQPKGVLVSHRNVAQFIFAIDGKVKTEAGVWLATTKLSFDISVLELLWTLCRGFQVVIEREVRMALMPERTVQAAERPLDFSLFYFASSGTQSNRDKYRLLLEGSRFADEHGFNAIWTPERHFHSFGGLYPNPSVTGAAVAAITRHVQIRAGSVVLPLHNPIRVAEEWSVVDNLSNGRAGISVASGWHANDFVFAPGNFQQRKKIMLEQVGILRRLWRGESVRFAGTAGHELPVKITPQPVQAELPIWMTAAGSDETFRIAGEMGIHLLTHLLGQGIEELERKIQIYRRAWREHEHAGEGTVSLMLHTFLGPDKDAVREKVREPFCNYLRDSIDLMKNLVSSMGVDPAHLQEADMQALLEHAFHRYFDTSGLFGPPEQCMKLVERLKAIGVDEVACLIDFGVDAESTLAALEHLNALRERAQETPPSRRGITHLQCTPSLARVLERELVSSGVLGQLKKLLIGGEALPPHLARWLKEHSAAEIFNVYGPTEATVWATAARLQDSDEVTIGRPLAGSQVFIVDCAFQQQAVGLAGELCIGGPGIARGYHNRPELTAAKFVPDPFGRTLGARLYRTGDLARYLPDGRIQFLGRLDNQIKIKGHRIELEEIESVLAKLPGVRHCAVLAKEEVDEKYLIAYVVPEGKQPSPEQIRKRLREELPEYMAPLTYKFVESMPLLASGKIDRKALAAIEVEKAETQTPFVAPRSPMEELVAGLWSKMLGMSKVSIHDDFFSLAGHSLLATQLVWKLRDLVGVDLPLRAVFESPTVSALAAFLEQLVAEKTAKVAMNQGQIIRAEETQKLLVTLQANGVRPPLFMMAPLGYSPLSYRPLSRYLGPEQPFYALQPLPAEQIHLHPRITVEEIASEYLREIRAVQPEGPYQLGGWSSGGLMAFEAAQQLRRKGESVHVVALLDAWAPGSRQAVSEIDDAALLVEIVKLAIADKGGSIDLSVEKMRDMSMHEQLNYAISRIREIAPASYHLNPEWLELQLQNIHLHQRAGRKYRPFPYDGSMVLFRAAETLPEDAKIMAEEGIDPVTLHYYGWNSLSTRKVEVEIIPGYHFNIVLEPEVGILAQRMQSYLLSPQSAIQNAKQQDGECIDLPGNQDTTYPKGGVQYG